MSLRALRTLVAFHRLGSFRAVSEAEGLTPSAVSHQMKNLERVWNLQLFDRSLKSPTLTQTGLAVVGEAATIIEAYDNLVAKVSAQDAISGDLILGAVPTALTGLIPAGLARLRSLHPDLRTRVVPGLTNQLLRQLERGQVDAAVISRPETLPETVIFSEIMTEELVLLVARKTANRPPAELLRTLPFIRFTRDAVVGRQIEAWLQTRGIKVLDAMELEGLDAISSMVAAELGVSIVPQSRFSDGHTLPIRRMALEADGPKRVLGIACRAGSPYAQVVGAVEEAFKEVVPH